MLFTYLRLFLFALLYWLILILPVSAQTIRFVSTTGTNTNPATATTWATSTTNLQGVIDASASGDQVWVSAGMYYRMTNRNSRNDRNISFSMKEGVAIYGGFTGNEISLNQRAAINVTKPSTTTLSAKDTYTGLWDGYHVIKNRPGLTNMAILDGFVIRDGRSDENYNYYGGGIYNNGSGAGNFCSPLIRNCLFTNNFADFGGAICNDGSAGGASSPILKDCSFLRNTAGDYGGAICTLSNNGVGSPTISDCLFQSNSASTGGAITTFNYYGGNYHPAITNCTFYNNIGYYSAGAVYNSYSNGLFTNCLFEKNFTFGIGRSQGGVMYNSYSTPVFTNCSFQRNSSISDSTVLSYKNGEGGVMYNNTSNPRFINCSFQNNFAESEGGTIYNVEGYGETCIPVLINCILWSNQGNNTIFNYNDYRQFSIVTAQYSLFNTSITGYNGSNNLTTNTSPFASITSAQLNGCSEAINAGDPATTSATVGATDLAGNPRFYNNERVDMGAYEYQRLRSPRSPINTVQNGAWDNPATWSCGCIPETCQPVTINHQVTVPPGYLAVGQSLQYGSGGRVITNANSRVRLGQ